MANEVKSPMVNTISVKVITTFMKIHIFLIALFYFKNWNKTVDTLNVLKSYLRKYRGDKGIQKISKVDGKYYWDMYGEAWPSAGFKRNAIREFNRVSNLSAHHVGMRNVLFGITTKCPLKCEHCYEWDNLNVKERLTFSDLKLIIDKLISYGVGQIHFGGGEPMMRFEDVLKLVKQYSDHVGFWLITSGFQLTEVRARQLKEAGLTGVCVSMDHHVEELHNTFRNYPQSYQTAQEAVQASNKAGLVTSLSLCTTKEFTQKKNLEAYVAMGRKLGVSFIQFLEPRAVGHYDGKDVKLSKEQKSVLEEVFLKVNTEDVHHQDPMIIYHEYYKPTMGCRGAGNGSFYIDPLGNVHACPFCRKSVGNIVTDSVEDCVDRLHEKGCTATAITSVIQNLPTLEVIEN
jgi:MoaA/NifB/PqqE/SkfB family radical SAM enzyme